MIKEYIHYQPLAFTDIHMHTHVPTHMEICIHKGMHTLHTSQSKDEKKLKKKVNSTHFSGQ